MSSKLGSQNTPIIVEEGERITLKRSINVDGEWISRKRRRSTEQEEGSRSGSVEVEAEDITRMSLAISQDEQDENRRRGNRLPTESPMVAHLDGPGDSRRRDGPERNLVVNLEEHMVQMKSAHLAEVTLLKANLCDMKAQIEKINRDNRHRQVALMGGIIDVARELEGVNSRDTEQQLSDLEDEMEEMQVKHRERESALMGSLVDTRREKDEIRRKHLEEIDEIKRRHLEEVAGLDTKLDEKIEEIETMNIDRRDKENEYLREQKSQKAALDDANNRIRAMILERTRRDCRNQAAVEGLKSQIKTKEDKERILVAELKEANAKTAGIEVNEAFLTAALGAAKEKIGRMAGEHRRREESLRLELAEARSWETGNQAEIERAKERILMLEQKDRTRDNWLLEAMNDVNGQMNARETEIRLRAALYEARDFIATIEGREQAMTHEAQRYISVREREYLERESALRAALDRANRQTAYNQ